MNLSLDKDENLEVRSASIYFENVLDNGSRVNGTIAITKEQYLMLEAKEILPAAILEPVIIEALGIGITEDETARFLLLEAQLAEKESVIEGLKSDLAAKTDELTAAIMEMMMIMAGAQEVGSPIPEVPTEPIPEPEIPEMPQEPEVPTEPIPDIPVEPTPEEPSPVEPEVPINEEPTEPMPEEPAPAEGTDSPTEPTPTETNPEDSTP